MSKSITFTLDGPPQGKGRARSTKTGIHYTPEKTALYETRMAWTFKQAAGVGWKMFEGAVAVYIMAKFAVPKSWSKKKKEDALKGWILPTVKCDADNIAKIILDSLNNIAYRDDSAVVSLHVEKVYSDTPQVVVKISLLDLSSA